MPMITETTQEEILPLQQLKEAVHDITQDDWILLRFLRARYYDVAKAEEMIRYAYRWRDEVGINNYLEWKFPAEFVNEMPYQYFGKDYDGSPAGWVRAGYWNGVGLHGKGLGNEMIKWGFAMFEKGIKRVQEYNSQQHIIIDLEGLSYRQVTHIGSMRIFYNGCQKLEQCYPEMMKSLIMINAPWTFQIAWAFLKATVSANTMQKVKIYGNRDEWLPALLRIFPIEEIPPRILKGGKENF